MRLSLRLREYTDAFIGTEHAPVSMELILEPFGFFYHGDPDSSLLVGIFLQALSLEFEESEWLDPIDVAAAAVSLGYEAALGFMDEAPWLMTQAAKRGHIALATT